MEDLTDLTMNGMIGIDPETGEFDIDLVPESIRDQVYAMAKGMIAQQPKRKGCHRKPKKKKKVPKTFGKNKKKKRKK